MTGFINSLESHTVYDVLRGDQRFSKTCDDLEKGCLILSDVSRIPDEGDFRLIFVANPLTRLIRVWKKLFHSKNDREAEIYKKKFGKEMKSDENGEIRFSTFINWLIENDENCLADENWAPITFQCDLCRIQYKFVGKLETFKEDFRSLSDNLSIGNHKKYENVLSGKN